MNITLFGYPNTGKTTLFNLLTGAGLETPVYEGGRQEPHKRTCAVPDERLDAIAKLYPDKKKVSATIDYIDLAGVSLGEVKDEAYLSHLRKADGLVHVVRAFEEPRIPPLQGNVEPARDIQSVEEALVLADLVTVDTRLEKLTKELMRTKNPDGEKEKDLLEKVRDALEKGEAVREMELGDTEVKRLKSFSLVSQKPLLHMVNLDEKDTAEVENPEKFYPEPKECTAVLAFCGKIEAEILELEEEERDLFLKEYGLRSLSAPRFVATSYHLLGVVTFFTVGQHEVRAWTIPEDTPAVQAAGTIHSDMERGFIRAEVISWKELLEHGSFQKAKESGAVRLEGKDYRIQDGDTAYFRFSV